MPNMLSCQNAIVATMVPRTHVVISDGIHCRASSLELALLIGVVAACVIALILMSDVREDLAPKRSNRLDPTGNPRRVRGARSHNHD